MARTSKEPRRLAASVLGWDTTRNGAVRWKLRVNGKTRTVVTSKKAVASIDRAVIKYEKALKRLAAR